MNLSALYDPAGWELTVPGYGIGTAPVHNPGRAAWSSENAHAHAICEVLFCLNGHAYLGVDGAVYPCSPGSIFIFPPFCAHDNNYPPDTPDLDHIWVSFLAGTVVLARHQCTHGQAVPAGYWQFPQAGSGLPDLSKPFNEVWDGFENTEAGVQYFRFHAAAVKIAELLIAATTGSEPMPDREKRQRMTVQSVCTHLEETGGAGATLESLAGVSGYSKYHFHRMFKEYAGATLHAYVEQCRVKKARRMLKEGKTKSETGYELGFSCPAAFSRWYKNNRTSFSS